MNRQREGKVDKTCEVCGASDLPCWLLTCSKCGASEHRYCRQISVPKDPKIWLCGPCEEKNSLNLQPHGTNEKIKSSLPSDASGTRVTGSNNNSPRKDNFKSGRAGKVKFLSIEEVMRIEVERDKARSPSISTARPCHSKAPMSHHSPRKTSKKSEYLRMQSPANTNRDPPLRALHTGMTSRVKMVPGQPALRKVNKEVPVKVEPPSKDVKASSPLVKDKPFKMVQPRPSPSKYPHESSPKRHCPSSHEPVGVGVGAALKADVPVRNNSQLMSCDASWTGQFQFSGSAILSGCYGEFNAYPHIRVHRRAFEFSGMIPEDFPVELIPGNHPILDSSLFKISPDVSDVALFFCPNPESSLRSDSSIKQFAHLLDLMKNQYYVIRGSVWDDVELLIFTSAHLAVESQWSESNSLLCGVFLVTKHTAPLNLSPKILPCVSAADGPNSSVIAKMDINEASAAGSKDDRSNTRKELERGTTNLGKRPAHEISPCEEWVKLSASSVARGGFTGAGGCVHGPSGDWIVGYVINMGPSPLLRADLCGLLYGLNLLSEKGYPNVLVETDSAEALESLKTEPDVFNPNRALIQNCRKLVGDHSKFTHVNRENNQPAVLLANLFEDNHPAERTVFLHPPVQLA